MITIDNEKKYTEIKDLQNILNTLSRNNYKLITLRYGLFGNRPHTLKEIARILRISKEWARFRETRIIHHLRIIYWQQHEEYKFNPHLRDFFKELANNSYFKNNKRIIKLSKNKGEQ